MNRRYFYFAILVLIIAGVLYLFLLQNDGIDERIEIQTSELVQREGDTQHIELTIKNVSQDTIPQLLIGIELYDGYGKKTWEGSILANDILPGQISKLERPLTDMGDVADFKIKSISEKTKTP